jgi:hypothetical protein
MVCKAIEGHRSGARSCLYPVRLSGVLSLAPKNKNLTSKNINVVVQVRVDPT